MAVVEWSDIQIKGISPGQTSEPSVEVFSRVRCATSVSDYLSLCLHFNMALKSCLLPAGEV